MCFPTCRFSFPCASFTSSSPVPQSLIDLWESTPGVRVGFCHLFLSSSSLLNLSPYGLSRPPPCWTSVLQISSNVCSLHYSWPQFGHQSLSKTSPELVLTVLLRLCVWCVSDSIIWPVSMTDTWREKLSMSVSPVHWLSRPVSISFFLSCGTKSLFPHNYRCHFVLKSSLKWIQL